MMTELVHQLFSTQCQLTTLRLDTDNVNESIDFYQYLNPLYHRVPDTTFEQTRRCCINLRYLSIRLKYTCSLEWIIEHVPALQC
jgi:hypothetical protein